MAHVKLKKGSVLTVPLADGMGGSSDDTSILTVVVGKQVATITAVKPGTTWATLNLAADLAVRLQVEVTT